MNCEKIGSVIKQLREARSMTQAKLAAQLDVSDKAVSKWETAKGLPDLSLIPSIAKALGVSINELISAEVVVNRNISANLLRSKIYVCPICGNAVYSFGEIQISCCGITLPLCEAEEMDAMHAVCIEQVEDEHFLTVNHPMTKSHYISFFAFVTSERVQMVKLYPEGNAETRMQLRGRGILYLYCNRHGLMKKRI